MFIYNLPSKMSLSFQPRNLLFLLAFVLSNFQSFSQSFIQEFDEIPNSLFQNMALFPNGDLLIADQHDELHPDFGNRGLYLMRLNKCGELIWAKTFNLEDKGVTFDQVLVSPKNEIYLLGTALHITREDLFILKATADGELVNYKIFEGASEDHFTYSLDYHNGQLALFGGWFEQSGAKDNFLVVLDESLELQWAKKYSHFEAIGLGRYSPDGGFIYQSGSNIVRLSPDGNPLWARKVEGIPFYYPDKVGFAQEDGFVFSAIHQNALFFYKLDLNGNLLWQTDMLAAYPLYPILQPFGNSILASYILNFPSDNQARFVEIDSNGNLSGQFQLELDAAVNMGFQDFEILDENVAFFLSTTDLSTPNSDLLIRFDPSFEGENCYIVAETNEAMPNSLDLNLQDLEITARDTTVSDINHQAIHYTSISPTWTSICYSDPQESFISFDSTLTCQETWQVSLPDSNYIWEDGHPNQFRTLNKSGVYEARKNTCDESGSISYSITVENCPCSVYIPNAFSPNFDGINDMFAVSAPCPIENFKMNIYDRWGELIFATSTLR